MNVVVVRILEDLVSRIGPRLRAWLQDQRQENEPPQYLHQKLLDSAANAVVLLGSRVLFGITGFLSGFFVVVLVRAGILVLNEFKPALVAAFLASNHDMPEDNLQERTPVSLARNLILDPRIPQKARRDLRELGTVVVAFVLGMNCGDYSYIVWGLITQSYIAGVVVICMLSALIDCKRLEPGYFRMPVEGRHAKLCETVVENLAPITRYWLHSRNPVVLGIAVVGFYAVVLATWFISKRTCLCNINDGILRSTEGSLLRALQKT
jgi:hypothetical protein